MALPDNSHSIKACCRADARCNILTFTVQNLRRAAITRSAPLAQWCRPDKPAETHRLSGSSSPAKSCEAPAAAIVEPGWISREISEPQTAEQIAL
ncbi:hypothetical protein VZT92_011328 [Zoarces viviparus]|uniref:Uncharacterized protein n=1 Tax=Zoarces viviparus TaxID=48416 RepID=A0AAW1FED6_ZOAVI